MLTRLNYPQQQQRQLGSTREPSPRPTIVRFRTKRELSTPLPRSSPHPLSRLLAPADRGLQSPRHLITPGRVQTDAMSAMSEHKTVFTGSLGRMGGNMDNAGFYGTKISFGVAG